MKKDKHISNVSNVSIDLSSKLSNNQSKGGTKMTKSVFKKVFATAIAFGIAATAFTTQSSAAGESSTTINGGTLDGGTFGFNPLSATLDGTQKTTSADWSISNIVDARGTGAGWNLKLKLTPFKEVDGAGVYVDGGQALASGSLFVSTAPTVELADLTSSELDTISTVTTGVDLDTNSEISIVKASVEGGMGSYAITDLGVTLTIPANTYAKTYKADATVSLNTAP
ncbi:WxL domain-containing protein [Lysinibacillus fusiformis]|nr:WxL domain-containing protein [Lysinibacillus fusiformis]